MGVTALPPRERVTILAGQLVREAVLQQSALSTTDAYCDQQRSAALLTAALDVASRCLDLADGGIAAATIEDLDFSPILRAKEEAATPDEVLARRDKMLGMLAIVQEPA
jgi:V/A-type H+-transporting ATPase subunit A